MSWVDKAHKEVKFQKKIDAAMRDPRYQNAEKKENRGNIQKSV